MRIFVTIHDDNSHSENPQPYFDYVPVETGSNVTLTCHAAHQAHEVSEMHWYNSTLYLRKRSCRNVNTCTLPLRWPVARGNFFCQVDTRHGGCFYKKLELKVAGESSFFK